VVDFLAGEYGGTSKNHRHQIIEDDFLARKARGADLLPEHHLVFKLGGRWRFIIRRIRLFRGL